MSPNLFEDALIARYLALSANPGIDGEIRTPTEQALVDRYVAMHRSEGAGTSRGATIEAQIDRYVAMASETGRP